MIDLVGLHDWQVVAVMNMAAGKPPGLVPSNVRIAIEDTDNTDSLSEKYKRCSLPMLHPYYVAGLLLPKDFSEATWKEIENFHRTQVAKWNRFNQNRTKTDREIWDLIQIWAGSPDTVPEGVTYQILKEMAHFVRRILLYLHHHYPTVIDLPAPELPAPRGVKRSSTGIPIGKDDDSVVANAVEVAFFVQDLDRFPADIVIDILMEIGFDDPAVISIVDKIFSVLPCEGHTLDEYRYDSVPHPGVFGSASWPEILAYSQIQPLTGPTALYVNTYLQNGNKHPLTVPPPYPDSFGNPRHAGHKYLIGSAPLYGKEIPDSVVLDLLEAGVITEERIDPEKRKRVVKPKPKQSYWGSFFDSM
jgi:hypothetical protein